MGQTWMTIFFYLPDFRKRNLPTKVKYHQLGEIRKYHNISSIGKIPSSLASGKKKLTYSNGRFNQSGWYFLHHKHGEFPWVMLVYQRIVSKKCMPPENWHILKIDAWKTTSPFKMVPLKRGRFHEFSGKIPQKEGNPTSTHFSTQIHKLQGPGFRNMAIFVYNPTNPQPTPPN